MLSHSKARGSHLNTESRHSRAALVSVGVRAPLRTRLNTYQHSSRISPHPLASPPRTSLHAQALHVGEGKGEAPTLQETHTRSLSALPDRLPLQGRPLCPVGVQIPASLWVPTGRGYEDP
jgi:hypothetical protein